LVRAAPAKKTAVGESGFVLIEILVSALVLVIASAGVVALLETTVRSQAEERHSSEAYALAQEDQARLSAMRVEDLLKLNETRTIKLNQTEFKVHSTGSGINDVTSVPSCGEGTYKVDYVEITSVVTWPGMTNAEKAKIVSKLSPSKGSLTPTKGSLAIQVTNQAQAPMGGVNLSGGGGAINGSTDSTGCAIFPNLPEGNYSLTVSGAAAGLVNKMGESSEVATVAVAGGDTRRFAFEFDRPGTIPVEFKYRVGSEEKFLPATADSVIANNTGMKNAKVFGTPTGTRLSAVPAAPLFPFSSAYTVYAGSCASNNPDPEGKGVNTAAYANVVAPPGATATPAVLQLPALELIVKKSGGAPLPGAKVTITDTVCKEAKGNLVKRIYTTNEAGMPSNTETGKAELGLPWGVYKACASASISGTVRHGEGEKAVESLSSPATLPIELTTSSTKGECP
jgi:type II secretory pathway pseudopilin PulG